MVEAINFVVRDAAGEVVRGAVAGGGSNFIQMGAGEEISLNLARESVTGYVQQGRDLVVSLADGQTITLSGYFPTSGEPNLLYLSQNGEIIAVDLAGAGNGTMSATYGATDSWDKFSTLDDLRFGESDNMALAYAGTDEPAGMAAFLPGLVGLGGVGAGLAGVGVIGAVIGGGGGGGGDGGGDGTDPVDTRATPTIDGTGTTQTVTTNTPDQDLDVTGTGEPGDVVVVTIGTETQTTTITTDGTWAVVFPSTDLPADGTHLTTAVVTQPDGTTTPLTGPTFILDLTPPAVEVTEGALSTNDVENLAEYADGVTISGEGEPGASISVQVGTFTQTTTVTTTGTWTVTFPTTQVPPGEYQIPMVVTATDPLGNTTVLNDTLVVDTVPNPIAFNPVTADNMVNSAEATAGFSITGTSTAGATLSITLQGITQQVVVASDGSFTLSWAAGTLTAGEYDATLTATTTDAAGNASTTTHTFRVDTFTSVAFAPALIEGNDVVNGVEAADGVVLTGTAQAGSSVSVVWNGTTLPATVAADGSWSVTFAASTITSSTTLISTTATVTATDAAGNTATATRNIQIDTGTSVSVDAGQLGGDNVASGSERGAGISFTGTTEANASVTVTFEGVSRTVTANASGVWTAGYTSADYRSGTYDSAISVTATDAAGNTATATHAVKIDTEVNPFSIISLSSGTDGISGAEALAGVTVTGTVEPFSTVQLTFGSAAALTVTAGADGTWTTTIPTSAIPAGETTVSMTAVATDRYGNVSAPITQSVIVDRIVNDLTRPGGNITADDTLNAAERAQGLTLNGTVEANSTLVVTLTNGATQTVAVGADGLWSVTFPASALPTGNEVSVTATIAATDSFGNTREITETFKIDTVAPTAPLVTDLTENVQGGVTSIVTAGNGAYDVFEITAAGVQTELTTSQNYDAMFNDTTNRFVSPVPDGSYLVIRAEDGAQNHASTLFIENSTGAINVDLGRDGLTGLDISVIDLREAAQASLTITEAQLRDLTGPDDRLIIMSDGDDQVTALGAVNTGQQTTGPDGQSYTIYTLGSSGATLLLDDDINLVI
ncbi:MAG: Ig-like domain-containing protein [Pseudomonadota bacterium]